jgi:RNA polymerase sigma-70 factor (ECF subfamily)
LIEKQLNDDAEVVQSILAGQDQRFATLVDRHQRAVRCMAASLLRDSHAADDLAQEVFLSAYQHLRSFDSDRAAFSTWLLTICRNKCLNELRRRPAAVSRMQTDVADSCRPWDRVCEAELMSQLDAALEELPLEQRLAFVLAELVGLSCEEIAEIEQVPAGTTRSRVSRARIALRSALKEFAGDAP